MSEKPSISLRYQLQLAEFQEAFRIASFGQKGLAAWVTTLLASAMILYGFYLGIEQGGKYYIIFGGIFSVMQLIIRFYLVPMMFKRQFVKHRLDQITQGIDLQQTQFSLVMNERISHYNYQDVQKSHEGTLCYVLELKNRQSVIVPKRAFTSEQQQTLFKQQFKLA
ncbi:MAG: YcxB family protein [Acinetobacter sp.]|nr:YcxB family protein [Acinetobacter sp.]